jgi:16S rRNA (cytidine1402-2'-O)-methyltransferase
MPDKVQGICFIVPTPIGNLADITLRAIEVLKTVAVIYAEDTRTSSVLLKKYGITTPVKSFHKFNEHQLLPHIAVTLESGSDIALISDAGTPGVSDPGFSLVQYLHQKSITVSCLPGATALIPALVMSGLSSDKFFFEGFLPHKKGRKTRLEWIAKQENTVILYESPYRLSKCISELISVCGEERKVSVIREISKIHEQVVTDSLGVISQKIQQQNIPSKGEIVIILAGTSLKKKKE